MCLPQGFEDLFKAFYDDMRTKEVKKLFVIDFKLCLLFFIGSDILFSLQAARWQAALEVCV